ALRDRRVDESLERVGTQADDPRRYELGDEPGVEGRVVELRVVTRLADPDPWERRRTVRGVPEPMRYLFIGELRRQRQDVGHREHGRVRLHRAFALPAMRRAEVSAETGFRM